MALKKAVIYGIGAFVAKCFLFTLIFLNDFLPALKIPKILVSIGEC